MQYNLVERPNPGVCVGVGEANLCVGCLCWAGYCPSQWKNTRNCVFVSRGREEGSTATAPRQGQVKWGEGGEGGEPTLTAQLTSVLILKLKTSYWLKLVFYAFIILTGFQLGETQRLSNSQHWNKDNFQIEWNNRVILFLKVGYEKSSYETFDQVFADNFFTKDRMVKCEKSWWSWLSD